MVWVHSIWNGKFSFRSFLLTKENLPIENASIFCSTTYSVESKTNLFIRAIARTSSLFQSTLNQRAGEFPANSLIYYAVIMRRNFIVWELILCQVHKDSIFPLVKFEREDNLLQSPSYHLKIFEVSLNELHCSSSLCIHRCRGDDRRQTSCGLRSAIMRKKHEKSKATWEVSLSTLPAGLISRRM